MQTSERPRLAEVTVADIGGRLLRWLFTDLIWATLPLFVMGLIAFLSVAQPTAEGHVLRPFWIHPEWSFASITLLAACLREMLRVKMEVEKANFNSTSAVLGAIIAAIVLNTALLGFIYAERLGAKINFDNVATIQIIFFMGSIALTFVIFWLEDKTWRARRARTDERIRNLEAAIARSAVTESSSTARPPPPPAAPSP